MQEVSKEILHEGVNIFEIHVKDVVAIKSKMCPV